MFNLYFAFSLFLPLLSKYNWIKCHMNVKMEMNIAIYVSYVFEHGISNEWAWMRALAYVENFDSENIDKASYATAPPPPSPRILPLVMYTLWPILRLLLFVGEALYGKIDLKLSAFGFCVTYNNAIPSSNKTAKKMPRKFHHTATAITAAATYVWAWLWVRVFAQYTEKSITE